MSHPLNQSGDRGEHHSHSSTGHSESLSNGSHLPARMNKAKHARPRMATEGNERAVDAEITEHRQEGSNPDDYRNGPFQHGVYRRINSPDVHNWQERRYPGENHNVITIKDLTHEQLMDNCIYFDLFNSHTDLKKAHKMLRLDIEAHTTVPSSHKSAPITPAPLSSGEISSAVDILLPPLKQEDYPRVKFWTRDAHKKYMAEMDKEERQAKKEANENVSSDYLEFEDGTTVSNEMASHMRKYVRSIFTDKKNDIPTKFSQCGHKEKQLFFNLLYAKYSFLRLCESDWKADILVARTLNSYSNSDKRRAKGQNDVNGKGKAKAKTEGKSKAANSEEDNSGRESSGKVDDNDEETPPPTPPSAINNKSHNSKRKAPQQGGQNKRSRQGVSVVESSRPSRSLSTQDNSQANSIVPRDTLLSPTDDDIKPLPMDARPSSLPLPAPSSQEYATSGNSAPSSMASAPRHKPGSKPRTAQEPEAHRVPAPASTSRIQLSSTRDGSRSPVDREHASEHATNATRGTSVLPKLSRLMARSLGQCDHTAVHRV